jgi:hypothetical protein
MENQTNVKERVPLCIKLDKEIRRDFNKITHSRDTTMQSVISSFITYYIKNPDKFKLQYDISMSINEGVSNEPTE